MSTPIDPIRLCCFQRASLHHGPQCPDGKVMCCMCFERFPLQELATDQRDGMKVDVCKDCWEHDLMRVAAQA